MISPSAPNRTIPLLRWAADIVANPPRSGDGFHRWLLRAAVALWKSGRNENEIYQILQNAAATCGRYVQEREIQDAIRNSYTLALRRAAVRYRSWPAVNHEQREAIVTNGGGLVDLWELSRPRIEDSAQHAEDIIDQLFPGNPLLCCGLSQSDFDTRYREEWRGELGRLQFIVPSVMTALVGKTQDGRQSKHTLSNTGARRFLVCEFDAGTIDEHAAILPQLAGYAPLVCAVFSGRKSLHGWFFVHGQPEEKVLKFFRYAVSLGADPMTWTRSQFVRLPDGTRSSGERQTVFFLNF